MRLQLDLRPEIAAALVDGAPVVALESTLITHGLPWPVNRDTAQAAEAAIRAEGVLPATIAVLEGRPTVGLSSEEIETLAKSRDTFKASRRDLASAVLYRRTAGTTVAATMFLAHRAGIRFFATGGIGGVHRGAEQTGDVSADLFELARTPVAVVCAGAKSLLDIPRTLEMLESLGVPVIGYQTSEFPAFYLRSVGEPAPVRVESPEQAAALLATHWELDGAGAVLAQSVPEASALDPNELGRALKRAEQDAAAEGIRGPALTPYLLRRLAEATRGASLIANQELVVSNARLAALVARRYADLRGRPERLIGRTEPNISPEGTPSAAGG